MTDDKPVVPGQPGFVRGNERLDQLLADPQLAADVAAAHADAEEMDRVNAMNLAMIRKAAQMTQVEVARKLGVGQGVVSRLEHRDDMLLSTLYDYLMATGAEGASIVVVVHGHRIELDLSGLRNAPPEQQSALSSPSPTPRDTASERVHIAAYRQRQSSSLSYSHGLLRAIRVERLERRGGHVVRARGLQHGIGHRLGGRHRGVRVPGLELGEGLVPRGETGGEPGRVRREVGRVRRLDRGEITGDGAGHGGHGGGLVHRWGFATVSGRPSSCCTLMTLRPGSGAALWMPVIQSS